MISNYLSKQAEGPGHEAGETPNTEMLEHAMGGEAGEQPHGTGPGGVDVEQLLSQLSPEELQALVAELSAGAGGGAGGGGDDVGGLSSNIASSLAQNPEAQVPGAPPEKAAALEFVKSAEYIEGFIKQALDYGLNVNEAVGMYDSALTTTVDALKKEAGIKEMFQGAKKSVGDSATAAYKGVSDKARGARDAVSKKYTEMKEKGSKALSGAKRRYEDVALSAAEHPGRTAAIATGAVGTAAGAGYLAGKSSKSDKEKKAAFLEGVYKQALARGFSEDEALEVTKEAAEGGGFISKMKKSVSDRLASGKARASKAISSATETLKAKGKEIKNKAEGQWQKGMHAAYTNPKRTIGAAAGAAGAIGGAGYLAGKSSKKDKEKKASFLEGVYKQALARGFSEDEAIQIVHQADAELDNN
jgi:DNA-binding transcriptional regulator YhcF (GntR family)